MSEKWVVLTILILNTLAAAAVLIWALFFTGKRMRVKRIMQSVFIFICPLVGLGYLAMSWLMLKLFFKKELDYGDISFSRERAKTLLAPDYDKEINLVPVEDALAVADKKSLRRLLLDILKDDTENSIPAIVLSLSSTDSETSHYAASMLMDITASYNKTAQGLLHAFTDDPDAHMHDGIEFVVLTLFYVSQKIFGDIEAGTHITEANNVADEIFRRSSADPSAQVMLSLCEAMTSAGMLEPAGEWAKRISLRFPDTTENYVANIKLSYARGAREDFFFWLDALKRSEVPIGYDILGMIRLFNKQTDAEAQDTGEAKDSGTA